jgi:hypothetical protein
VAVTRPKNRLIIFDDIPERRRKLQTFWTSLGLIDILSEGSNINQKSGKSIAIKTSKGEWRKQGFKMFRNKYFEQAYKCFVKTEDEKL